MAKQVVIENPTITASFAGPKLDFLFEDEGRTNQLVSACLPTNPPFNDSDSRSDLLKKERQALEVRQAACRRCHLRLGAALLFQLAPIGTVDFVLANGSILSN